MARHLITSALPYINGVKHLGNLIGSMLPSDVFARYLRQQGHDVLLICATDEHGTPAELAALEEGLPVEEFCRRQHEVQARLAEGFALSFDHFGRSSSPQNHELTQHFARRLEENGFIEERETRQVYSVADGRFLPDRYVIGTCPHCGYEAARGDQCESCTRLLEPTQLIDPRSAVSGSTELEIRTSKHLFLLQSKLAEDLRRWIDTKKGGWPVLATSIAYKWLDEGLEDRSITRDLSWGVPVGRPGFEGKVFYVWFDAPIEYIGATKEWDDGRGSPDDGRSWRSWWFDADDVTYTQFMAKDNVPFHTITFPASILGAREPWKLPDYLKAFNWLNYYGGKFSTSRGVGVFMDAALELRPADDWRWYLVANAPESSDSSFTWELFAGAVNKDLVGTLGNFVNRAVTLTVRSFGEVIPAGGEPGDEEAALVAALADGIAAYRGHLEAIELRKAASQLRELWTLGNAYLEQRVPWKTAKVDLERTACTLRTALNLARLYAVLSHPIIPGTSDRLIAALGDGGRGLSFPDPAAVADELSALPPGQAFTPPGLLFSKVEDEDVARWVERFGGPAEATA